MPYYIITAYDITYDFDKEEYISVGADGEDYYEDPTYSLSKFFQFRVHSDELPPPSGVEGIEDKITERTGFCVKSFSTKTELDERQEPEMTDELFNKTSESEIVEKLIDDSEEEEVEEGIPPQLPAIPYPPPKLPSDKWENYCETEEREDEITMEFVKFYELPSLDSIKYFVNNYKGENEMMPIVKKFLDIGDSFIYDRFIKIMESPLNKEKCKDEGKMIYYVYGLEQGRDYMSAMRSVFYLVSWYFESSNNMCIKAYPRLLEHYWSGIGDWAA